MFKKYTAVIVSMCMIILTVGCAAKTTDSTQTETLQESTTVGATEETTEETKKPDADSSATEKSRPERPGGMMQEENNINDAETVESYKVEYADEDTVTTWTDDATTIELDKENVNIDGENASYADGIVTISKEGTYVVSGTLNDGQILVDADKEAVVHLILNGVNISCSTSAAINAAKAAKLIVTLADGTDNIISDAKEYIYPDSETDEPDAALFVKNDLTINGTGSLKVNSNSQNGIKCKDNLLIMSGTMIIDSTNDALKGKDSIGIVDGDITISAADDGITTDGDMIIDGGVITVTKSAEAMEGMTVTINGGVINLTSEDDGINASAGTDSATTEQEKEQIKMQNNADVWVHITGGKIYVNAMADGIDSNGSLYIEGGEVYVSGPTGSGDGTLDYNGSAFITGGVFIGAGSTGMVQQFSDKSKQNSFMIFLSASQQAESEISVKDSKGNIIASWTNPKGYATVLISSPDIKTGETYTVSAGNESTDIIAEEGTTQYGENTGRGMGDGHRGMNGRMSPDGGNPQYDQRNGDKSQL